MGRDMATVSLISTSDSLETSNERWPDLRPRGTGMLSWVSNLPSKRVFIAVAAALFFLMTTGLFRNHSSSNSASSRKSLDIVVSMYNENETAVTEFLTGFKALHPIRELDTRVIVYIKDQTADAANIEQALAADEVHVIPNRGREGGTFLHHIINSWDTFGDHTLFMQAWVHVFDHVQHRVEEFFVPDTGVLPLGDTLQVCNATNCQDPWNSNRTFPRLPEIYSATHKQLCPEYLLMGYGGQMIVSKERIRKTDKSIYEHLKGVLESDPEHWIHDDPKENFFEDSVSNPYFGHTIERSWMTLFGCSDPSLASTCPSIALHRYMGEGPEKCQCLDAPASILFSSSDSAAF